MPILVAGATGIVGGEIVERLRRRGIEVRALLRGGTAHPKAQMLRDAGVEVADGDLTFPETLPAACAEIDTVISTVTSMPSGANDGLRRVDHEGNLALIAAAEHAGAKHFVYVSYSGNLREDSPLERAKRDCENHLLQSSMRAVILRPSYFMEMWLSPALGFDAANGSARIYGTGEGKVSYISSSDVADFAVAAATREPRQKNTILEMGGPEPLSQLDAVAIFEGALGNHLQLQFVPVEALLEQHKSADPLQKTFAALMVAYTKGDTIPGAQAVASEYGVPQRTVADHAADVARQARSAA